MVSKFGKGGVVLDLQANTSLFAKNMNNATRSMGGFEGALKSTMLRFVGLTAVIGLAVKGVQMVTKYVTESIQAFRKFETTMAEVSTILDDQGMTSLPQLTAGVQRLSKEYGKAANDIGNALYEILSAAVAVEDAMYLLNTAVKASIAGLTDIKTAVDILTSIMNSYGDSVAQAARISDYLFQTVIRGKLHFEDFASSIGYISPIAANAGVAFKEIAAAMSTATRMGLHLDMTSRGLALGIQNIVSPTEGAADAAKKYGVEVGPLAFRLHGLQGIMQQLHDASVKYGKHIIGEIVPNMRSLRVFAALAGEQGIKGLSTDMGLLTNSTGAMETAMNKMMDTSERLASVLTEQLAYSAREVGDAWDEIAIAFDRFKLGVITFITGGWGGMTGALDEFDERVREIAEGPIKDLLAGMSKGPTVFERFSKQFEDTWLGGVPNVEALMEKTIDYGSVLAHVGELQRQTRIAESWEKTTIELSEARKEVIAFERDNKRAMATINALNIETPEDIAAGTQITEERKAEIVRYLTLTNTIIPELETRLKGLINNFEDVGKTAAMTADDFLALKSVLDDFTDAIDYTETTLDQLTITIENLETEIAGLGEQLATMVAEDDILDQLEDIDGALAGDADAYALLTEEMKKHIDIVLADQEAMDALTRTIQVNNLEIMKIEYAGMKNRDRLSRSQQMKIKKLQMENAKARIEQLEADLRADDAELESSQDVISEQRRLLEIQLQDLRNTRDEDIINLRATIEAKEGELENYHDYQVILLDKLLVLQDGYLDALLELQQEFSPEIIEEMHQLWGIDIPAEIELTNAAYRETIRLQGQIASGGGGGGSGSSPPPMETPHGTVDEPGGIGSWDDPGFTDPWGWGFQRGTQSVPYTGLAMVHKGETISPAGKDTGGGNTVNINLGGVAINNEMDEAHFSALLSNSVRRGLIDARTGQSRMRYR